jgi:DNA-binding beta-propeller fold protein YncE
VTPRALAIGADGATYVLDVRTPRVLVLDEAGALVRTIAFSEPPLSPADVAVGAAGEVWVADGLAGSLWLAEPGAGTAAVRARFDRDTVGLAHAVALDDQGRPLVVDRGRGRLVALERDGTRAGAILGAGWGQGELRYPGGIAIDERGNVFIADRENDRVQVFRLVP